MGKSRHSQNPEEICARCGQIRSITNMRRSKNSEGEPVLICKSNRNCGKESRVIIKALLRRTCRDIQGNLLSNRRIQWVFEEIGHDQIKLSGPLIPLVCPTFKDVQNLIDGRRKLTYVEEENYISVVCLSFKRATETKVEHTDDIEDEEMEQPVLLAL